MALPCGASPPFRQGFAGNSQESVLASEPFGGNRGITLTLNTPEDDERELIDRAQAGEANAFERLAERHAARLWRCALALGKDGHWAEDLAQETLVEAWRSLARFDGRCQFSTWLYGVLRHRFLKGRRHQNAARLSAPDALGRVPCTACTPDCSAEASEDVQRVRRAGGDSRRRWLPDHLPRPLARRSARSRRSCFSVPRCRRHRSMLRDTPCRVRAPP